VNTGQQHATSLGPALVARDGVWVLDLASLPILHGLSVLSRALAEMVVGHARSDRYDIAIERRLRQRENPELVDVHGVEVVRLVAEPAVLDAIAVEPETFEHRLRALLGSLQRARYRDVVLAKDRGVVRALVAEFGVGDAAQRFVLEHVPARRDATRGAFRISIETGMHRRLDLDGIPHVVIENVEDRSFIAGSTRIAQTWAEGARREAERGRRSFGEARSPHSHLFRQLDHAGWPSLQRVVLQWAESAQSFLLESDPDTVSALLKRVLLACEDRQVRARLAAREVVRVDAGELSVWLDLAQLGRVLALSLGQRRERADADSFLARMPCLQRATTARTGAQPLHRTKVFLVHHMTAEIVGTIAALRRLGCRDLVVLFVTYAGEPPASYLDAVLDLPADEFRSLALVNVPTPGHVEGHYRLSTHYSLLDEAPAITAALQTRGDAYLPAMRAAAVVPFLRQLARAEAAGERLLLVEDGGYLAPVVQESLLCGRTVAEFAAALGHACADVRPLADLLRGRLGTTIEHTRNGFDRLAEVQARHGKLALPSFSIAISRLKRAVESREVAASILNAVETVLNADGRVLARRSALVLGCHGAIGSELVRALHARLDAPERQLFGVDLRAGAGDPCPCTRTLAEVPGDRWLATELVLGVTGDSLVGAAEAERWLLHGTPDTLVLASGSTKKVEFRGLMHWFDGLQRAPSPDLQGHAVEVGVEELLDPRTARLYGHRWTFLFPATGRRRTILALAHLTPINFLFYGVATELIDEVLTQLVTLAVGALATAAAAPKALLAVDRDVDADARPLAAK
jgi:hypothetical protein